MEACVGRVRDVHEHSNRSNSGRLNNEQAPAPCAHSFVVNCALHACANECLRLCACVRVLFCCVFHGFLWVHVCMRAFVSMKCVRVLPCASTYWRVWVRVCM